MKNIAGRKLYSLTEFYTIYYKAIFSATDFIYAKKNGLLSEHFIERLMLAVTEVNGCLYCSYAHTKMALEAGMSNKEIQNILSGINDDVPADELSAILFSEYYAESRGNPTGKSWKRIVKIYGLREAKGILGAIRIMMFGNAAGVAWGSFVNRFKKAGETDQRSSVIYEIAMVLGTFVYLPVVLLHVLIKKILWFPVIRFEAD